MAVSKGTIYAVGLSCIALGLLLIYLGVTGVLAFRTTRLAYFYIEEGGGGELSNLEASWNINDVALPLLGVIEVDPKGKIEVTITVKNDGTTPFYYAPCTLSSSEFQGKSWMINLVYAQGSVPAKVRKYLSDGNYITLAYGTEKGFIDVGEKKTFKTSYTFNKDFIDTEWYVTLSIWDEIEENFVGFSTLDDNIKVKVVYNPKPQATFDIVVISGTMLTILGVALTIYGKWL